MAGHRLHTDADAALAALGAPRSPRATTAVTAALQAHAALGPRVAPARLGAPSEVLVVLYSLVQARRPARVLETGAADGCTTRVLLEALEATGDGELHSVDVTDGVGRLVTNPTRWHHHRLAADSPWLARHSLARLMETLGPVDLFVHDSDRSYEWQMLEYLHAARTAPLLATTAASTSWAFFDFVAVKGIRAEVLWDRTRAQLSAFAHC